MKVVKVLEKLFLFMKHVKTFEKKLRKSLLKIWKGTKKKVVANNIFL